MPWTTICVFCLLTLSSSLQQRKRMIMMMKVYHHYHHLVWRSWMEKEVECQDGIEVLRESLLLSIFFPCQPSSHLLPSCAWLDVMYLQFKDPASRLFEWRDDLRSLGVDGSSDPDASLWEPSVLKRLPWKEKTQDDTKNNNNEVC